MTKRFLFILIATAAAAALFVLTLFVGPSEPPAPPTEANENDGPPVVAPYFDPDRVENENLNNPALFQNLTGGHYRFREERRETLLFYDRVTPQPHGVLDVEQPIAQVYFSAARVMEIRADACTFIAPDNQPRGGDFRGDVIVTLFETADGSPVAFDNPDHVQLRAHLDDATFDLDLGQLETDGSVRLAGREVEFRGRGLSLIYNELRRRIERLEIAQGDLLRFASRPDADETSAAADEPRNSRPATSRRPDATEADTATTPHPPDATAQADADTADEVEAEQFYRARFERDVRVEAEGGSVQITADTLDAVFTLRSNDWNTTTTARSHPPAPTPYALASADPNAIPPQAGAQQSEAPDPHTTDPPAHQPTDAPIDHTWASSLDPDRVVTIRWRGPMVLEPELEPSDDLAGPDDMLLRLVGAPARFETADDEQLLAREIEYITTTGRIRATGTTEAPMQMRSADLGELHAIALDINQHTGVGHVQGPGWLRNANMAAELAEAGGDAEAADVVAEAANDDSEAEAIRVAWQEQLDLRFYRDTHAATADDDRPGDRLRGLEVAHFHGSVRVDHADFELDVGQLALHLHPPIDNRQAIRTIEATHGTRLVTTSLIDAVNSPDAAIAADTDTDASEGPQQATVAGNSLTVAFERDEQGASHARQLVVRGQGVIDHPDWRLAADDITADLADNITSTSSTSPGGVTSAALHHLTAERDVRFELYEDATELVGHRMVVDIPNDQLELFAEDADAPAHIVRPDTTLAGPHLILTQADRAVRVQGPGWLDARLDPDDPDARLMVNWQQSMHYSDTTGMAHLVGQVTSQTDTSTSRTRLTAEDLRFELATSDDTSQAGAERSEAPDTTSPLLTSSDAFRRRHVRFATARDNALFAAESLAPDTGDRLSRIEIKGPLISFDGEDEQVQVIGDGRMVIIDERPRDAAADTTDAGASDVMPGVGFTGRGATVFFWQRQLTLDAARNDVLFEQGVQMLHRPLGRTDVLQLDAQRLYADMTETGGLANWTDRDRAANPDVQLIRADDTVRVLHEGRTILTDHLQYTAADQLVRLWAEADNMVRVSRSDQPTDLSAEQLKWDLSRDRFEATRLGPGIVPIPAE